MSRPGDIGWTLIRYETDEAGVKVVRHIPLPGDPRRLERAISTYLERIERRGALPHKLTDKKALDDALCDYRAGR